MIWIWIAIAILISVFLLRRKHISIENYIWVLLPVDMYGINIGFTLKPYMIFCLVLLFRMFASRKAKLYVGRGTFSTWIILCIATVIVNILNNKSQSSVMSALMLFVVFLNAAIYLSNVDESVFEIPDVLVATSIGYGIVFIFAYVFAYLGINIQGAFTTERMSPGIVMQFSNFLNNQLLTNIRLRGFSIDPNTVIGLFIAPVAVDVLVIFCDFARSKRHFISLIVSMICIMLTNSRTALFITIIIVLLSSRYAMKNLKGRDKGIVTVVSAFMIVSALIGIAISGVGNAMLSKVLGSYNRSGLTDTAGRLSIWKEAAAIWNERGLIAGIGFDQMQYLSGKHLACHNTWLEWLCSSGLIVGGPMIIYYFSNCIQAIRLRTKVASEVMVTYDAILFGLLGVVLALVTVDNVTNSYLCFYLFTINKLRNELIN